MAETASLDLVSITEIKRVVDMFADLGITPSSLYVAGPRPLDSRPRFEVWAATRTDFNAICDRLGIKPAKRVEGRYPLPGQRQWHAIHDTGAHRLLIQVVSFQHHPDWEPRQPVEPVPDNDSGGA